MIVSEWELPGKADADASAGLFLNLGVKRITGSRIYQRSAKSLHKIISDFLGGLVIVFDDEIEVIRLVMLLGRISGDYLRNSEEVAAYPDFRHGVTPLLP